MSLDHKFLNELQYFKEVILRRKTLPVHFKALGPAWKARSQGQQGHGLGVGHRLRLLHGALSRGNLIIILKKIIAFIPSRYDLPDFQANL